MLIIRATNNITRILTLYKCKLLSLSTMYHLMSLAAVVAYFIPIILVLLKKAWRDPFFRLFGIYWSLGGICNLFDVIPGVPHALSYDVGVFYNMLDMPFILAILYYTSAYSFVKKTALGSIALVAVLSILGVLKLGVTYDSLKYSLAVGVASVIGIGIVEIVRYMQKIEHSPRQNAKMFIYAGLMFQYVTFIVIYIFDYVIESENRKDSFIIYYASSVVAMLIACCGFMMFRTYEMNKRKNFMKDSLFTD